MGAFGAPGNLFAPRWQRLPLAWKVLIARVLKGRYTGAPEQAERSMGILIRGAVLLAVPATFVLGIVTQQWMASQKIVLGFVCVAVVWCVALLRIPERGDKESAAPKFGRQLNQMVSSACRDVAEEWVRFHRNSAARDAMPLEERLEGFVKDMQPFLDRKYPLLSPGSNGMFWLTTLTAILESGTHPKADINAAIAALRVQYERK
jgi:hypothetical protein